MDLMATWREHFTLRYAPTRLIRFVFAAGTIYLFSARRAVKGVRPAQKELQYAMRNTDLCIKYLKEIGETWFCATKTAEILKDIFRTRVKPEIEPYMPISPASPGILPPKGQERDHPRTNGAGNGKKRSVSRKRPESSNVDDNPQDSNNRDSHQRIGNETLPIPIPPPQVAVHTPIHSPTPAQILQLPTPPSSQLVSPGYFRDLPSLPLSSQYPPVQPTQPVPISPPAQMWTGLSAGRDGSYSHFMPPHIPDPFNVNGMNAPQRALVDDRSRSSSTRPISPMSYLLAMPNGRGLGETPFIPFSAELGEDPMTAALNQLGLALPQPGEEVSVDPMDVEWREQGLYEGLDVAEFTNLYE